MDSALDWLYFEGRKRRGPIPKDDLQSLFDAGRLPGDALIRTTEATAEWFKAFERDVFRVPPVKAPPKPPPVQAIDHPLESWADGPQTRPWVRYWARTLDMSLFSYFAMALLVGLGLAMISAFGPSVIPEPDPDGGALQTLLWSAPFWLLFVLSMTFVEALFMTMTGTTPGKWLLNVRVRDEHGQKLGFGAAFGRTLGVWFKGMAAFLPFLAPVTQVLAFFRLRNLGQTSWDERGGHQVIHRYVPGLNVFFYLVLAIGVPIAVNIFLFSAVMLLILGAAGSA